MSGVEYLNVESNFVENKLNKVAYQETTFESDDKLIDWEKKEFLETRKFSIKNIRDIFFSLMN